MANGTWTECHTCKTVMWIPEALNEAALRNKEVIYFYCPYGHSQVYLKGESLETKLRGERDRLAQRVAERDDELRLQRERTEATERRLSAAKGQVTKIKNRVGHGVCPCCTRSFGNLQRHMQSQHPDYSNASEAVQ